MRASILVVGLVVSLAACSPGMTPKPTATATLHWYTVQMKLASYCWSSGGQGVCADSAGADILLRTGYLVPVRTAGCQAAVIKFSSAPRSFGVALEYSSTGASGQVKPDGFQFDIASRPGTYVYDVTGTWAEGDVSFYLPLEVIPGCA